MAFLSVCFLWLLLPLFCLGPGNTVIPPLFRLLFSTLTTVVPLDYQCLTCAYRLRSLLSSARGSELLRQEPDVLLIRIHTSRALLIA